MLICLKHHRILVCEQNSVYAEQLVDDAPYQIWATDKWRCPEPFCDTVVLITAQESVVEHWEEAYARYSEKVGERFKR